MKELLDIDPMLVFGEGEYGVTDMLYAAARSKRSEVFRMFLEVSAGGGGGEVGTRWDVIGSEFKWEMMNRAVHAAARGGDLGTLKELLRDCSDVSVFRDAQGSTILHTASGRGQVEVAEYILGSYDIISLTDNQGNGPLNVAAYRGHLPVVKVLILKSPSSTLVTNNCGDTFLHMAVAGFRTPGFRMVDRQIELMKHLLTSEALNLQDIINARNNDGRTALHIAVTGNIKYEVVELLMNAPFVDLNIRDAEGLTPLDLLKQQPQSASSEILIKRLACVGGISNCEDHAARRTLVSNLKMQGGIAGISPGTSFRVSDAEIVVHMGMESDSEPSHDAVSAKASPCSSDELSQVSGLVPNFLGHKKSSSVSYAARRLRVLLQWPQTKGNKFDCSSSESYSTFRDIENHRSALLRHKFSKPPSLPNNMRTHSLRSNYLLRHSARKNFVAGLMQGVIKVTPQEAVSDQSPSSSSVEQSVSSSSIVSDSLNGGRTASAINKQASFDKRLINQYFCLGAQGLAVEDTINNKPLAAPPRVFQGETARKS